MWHWKHEIHGDNDLPASGHCGTLRGIADRRFALVDLLDSLNEPSHEAVLFDSFCTSRQLWYIVKAALILTLMSKPICHVKKRWLNCQRVHVSLDAKLCVLLHEEELGGFRRSVTANLQGLIGTSCCWEGGKRIGRGIGGISRGWRTILGPLLGGISRSIGSASLTIRESLAPVEEVSNSLSATSDQPSWKIHYKQMDSHAIDTTF